jgi:hypothetical protein
VSTVSPCYCCEELLQNIQDNKPFAESFTEKRALLITKLNNGAIIMERLPKPMELRA